MVKAMVRPSLSREEHEEDWRTETQKRRSRNHRWPWAHRQPSARISPG